MYVWQCISAFTFFESSIIRAKCCCRESANGRCSRVGLGIYLIYSTVTDRESSFFLYPSFCISVFPFSPTHTQIKPTQIRPNQIKSKCICVCCICTHMYIHVYPSTSLFFTPFILCILPRSSRFTLKS